MGANLSNIVGSFTQNQGLGGAVQNIASTVGQSLGQQSNPQGISYESFPRTPNTTGTRSFANVFEPVSGDSDYARAAKATALGNLAAAQAQSSANRVNQINPYGSIQYYQTGVDAQGNPTYAASANLAPEQQALLNAQNFQSLGLAQTANRALGNVYDTYGQSFNVDPYMQQMVGGGPNFAQYGGSPNLGMTGQAEQARGLGYNPQASTVDLQGRATGVGGAEQARGIGTGELAQRIYGGPQFQGLEMAQALRQAGDTGNLQKSLGENVGMQGWDRASNLIMQRLEPQLQRQQERLDAQLASQGIPIGSEAYTRAKQDLAMQQNDLRTQAQLQAQNIQQNLFGQELAAGQFGNQATTQQQQNLLQNLGFSNQAQQQDYANRQTQLAFNNQLGQQGYQNLLAGQAANNAAIAQNFGQGLQAQQLGNQAAQQNYANLLAGAQLGNQAVAQNQQTQLAQQAANNAALAQNFGQGLQAQQLGNQAAQQNYTNALAQQQANNAAAQQMFANQTTLTGLGNQDLQQAYQNQMAQQQANNAARQNNFALASYLRGLPMQELNALRQGSQVTNPSFIGVPQTGQVAGPDLLSAYQAQQNANIAAQNRQAAQQSNLTSGLFNLGGSLLGNIGGVVNTVGNIGSGIINAGSNLVSSIGKMFSDSRLKENIKPVGILPNGLTLYSFEYKDEIKDHEFAGHGVHVGVMADEVEKVFPYAVETLNDGYKVVNYGLLP